MVAQNAPRFFTPGDEPVDLSYVCQKMCTDPTYKAIAISGHLPPNDGVKPEKFLLFSYKVTDLRYDLCCIELKNDRVIVDLESPGDVFLIEECFMGFSDVQIYDAIELVPIKA